MSLIELKSPDRSLSLQEILNNYFSKQKMDLPQESQWAFYVSDRMWNNWNKIIRPRSKIVGLKKDAQKPNLEVVFENKEFLILNKPENLPTQKTLKTFEDNLYDQVHAFSIIHKNFPQGLPYIGLHHRLDRMTSGLVLMSKQRSANKEIADLFQYKKIHKEYLAYCQWSEKKPAKKWVEKNQLGRVSHKKHRFYFGVVEKGDKAETEFELLKEKESEWFLMSCKPRTGRTHQLRVQLSHLGFAIIGDWVYGKKQKDQRLMLHARSLDFKFRGENYSFRAEPNWDEPKS